jgi:hypothetical protein
MTNDVKSTNSQRLLTVIGLILLAGNPGIGLSQQPPHAILDSVAAAVPKDVKGALDSAASRSILSVSGVVKTTGQIIKADRLVFGNGSELVVEAGDLPWVVIAARELKFQSSGAKATIRVAPAKAPTAGRKGRRGAHGASENKFGRDGHPGSRGETGGSGSFAPFPPRLYVIVDRVLTPDATTSSVRLVIKGEGAIGGMGGPGGDGGNGGAGAMGRPPADGDGTCRAEAGVAALARSFAREPRVGPPVPAVLTAKQGIRGLQARMASSGSLSSEE